MLPKLTLVLGGASSGKTAFAENLTLSDGRKPVYLATGQAFDAEMTQKIERHRAARVDRWHTIEEPLNVADRLAEFSADEIVLLDCLTLWITNHMMADHDLATEGAALMAAIGASAAPVIVVSNEVGHGVVPENKMARQFRTLQGHLNQTCAARADLVVAIMAGLPLVLKGQLP